MCYLTLARLPNLGPKVARAAKLALRLITAWLAATAALEPNCSKPAEMSLFTKIIRKEIPSCKVGAGELWYAFLDINPRRAGHTLVVPVEEKQRLAELSSTVVYVLALHAELRNGTNARRR